MAENFLAQLVQSGALNVPNPMEAYKNALTMKRFQTEMKSAELSDEVKMMTILKTAVGSAQTIKEYGKVRSYYSQRFPGLPERVGAPTEESFGGDEKKYRVWNVGITEGLSAAIKLERGEKTTFTVEKTDGSTYEIELTQEEYDTGVANKTIDPERTYRGKQTKESIVNIKERAEATAAGTAAGKPPTVKEQAEAAIAKSEGLGARLGEDIPGEELEKTILAGKAGERTLQQIAAMERAPDKPDYDLFKTATGGFEYVKKGTQPPPGAKPYEKEGKESALQEKIDAITKAHPDWPFQKVIDEATNIKTPGLDPLKLTQVFQIKTAVQNNPIVKDYIAITSQTKRLDTAMAEVEAQKKAGGPLNYIAVDQTLITILNKMLDPTSVVRESEYARTPDDQGIMNKVRGKWAKLSTGGAGLTDQERTAIYRMSKRFGKVAEERLKPEIDNITKTLQKYGVDPADILSPTITGGAEIWERGPDGKPRQVR